MTQHCHHLKTEKHNDLEPVGENIISESSTMAARTRGQDGLGGGAGCTAPGRCHRVGDLLEKFRQQMTGFQNVLLPIFKPKETRRGRWTFSAARAVNLQLFET